MESDNEKAKREFIIAFHDGEEERLSFLEKLYDERRQDEALTLCVCYIDRYSQLLMWPNLRAGKNFVDAVINYGGNPIFTLVHPLQAIRAFGSMASFWKEIAKMVKTLFPGPDYELLTTDEFIAKLKGNLGLEQLSETEREIWRTTMAALAYYNLRNPSIHGIGAGTLSFSMSSYKGNSIENMDFHVLHLIAQKLHTELRRRSEKSNQWFGNDRIVYDGLMDD